MSKNFIIIEFIWVSEISSEGIDILVEYVVKPGELKFMNFLYV